MSTQPDPSHLIAELQQAIDATEAYRAGIQVHGAALDAAPYASKLTRGLEVRIPDKETVLEAAHAQIHAWAEDALLPEMRVALPWDRISDTLRGRSSNSRWADYGRKWSDIPLEETAAYIIDTYAKNARSMAGSQIYKRFAQCTSLNSVSERAGRLTFRIYARSDASFSGGRRIEYQALRTLRDAVDAIDMARRWLGETIPAMTSEDVDALERGVGEHFAYRAKIPLTSGHLVLFKEHVEFTLTPDASSAVSLFLSEFHTEAA